jgi:virginiamycin B lyase
MLAVEVQLKEIGSPPLKSDIKILSPTSVTTNNTVQIYSPSLIRNFSLPLLTFDNSTTTSGPNSIAAGPNGTFWVAQFLAGNISEFFTSNDTIREFQVPEVNANPNSIAVDQFGTVWFSDFANGNIWSLDPSTGAFTKYPIPTAGAEPLFIVVDKNHNIWFTETTGYKIGELAYPSYTMSEYSVPTAMYEPLEMALDQNTSTLWITLATSLVQPGAIASFNTTTRSFEKIYTPPVSLQDPVGIVLDKNGNVWVSEHRGSSVVEFDPTNSTWKKYVTSPPPSQYQVTISAVATLAIDSQGNFWFIEHFSNKVGVLDPSTGVIEEFDLTGTDDPFSVLNAVDDSGNFWFTNYGQNAIQMIPVNTTTGIYLRTLSPNDSEPYPKVGAGQTISASFVVKNLAPYSQNLTIAATSSFSADGSATPQEVVFNVTGDSLRFASNQSTVVGVKITPDASLSSGLYSVSFAAIGQNSSTVQVFFIEVSASPLYIFYHLGDYLEEILIAAVLILAGVYFFFFRPWKSIQK